jgi:hypothetical protein
MLKVKVTALVLAAALFGGALVWRASPKPKFSLDEIVPRRSSTPNIAVSLPSPTEMAEVFEALNQPYQYFGAGGQSHVFFSEDGRYALKFLKQARFEDPQHLKLLPPAYKSKKKKRMKRQKHEYMSYVLAMSELKEETALLYVHLGPSTSWNRQITLTGPKGETYTVSLDDADFLLQRRGDLVLPAIGKAMDHGDLDTAKTIVSEVIQLIVTRCEKGFRDRDPNIITNCGILYGEKPTAIKVDAGRFSKDPDMARPLFMKPELYALLRPLRTSLAERYPQLADHLDREFLQIVGSPP